MTAATSIFETSFDVSLYENEAWRAKPRGAHDAAALKAEAKIEVMQISRSLPEQATLVLTWLVQKEYEGPTSQRREARARRLGLRREAPAHSPTPASPTPRSSRRAARGIRAVRMPGLQPLEALRMRRRPSSTAATRRPEPCPCRGRRGCPAELTCGEAGGTCPAP